jgi:hypothetical protein
MEDIVRVEDFGESDPSEDYEEGAKDVWATKG